MRYKLFYKVEGSEEIREEILEEDVHDAEARGRYCIDVIWNSQLRPHEKRREFVRVEVLDSDSKGKKPSLGPHKYMKSNLVTKEHNGRTYDEFVCTTCGLYAWAYGIRDKEDTNMQIYPKDAKKGYSPTVCRGRL